jgi:hypothetical protein
MEVLGTVACDHEYSVIVRLGIHDILEMREAVYGLADTRKAEYVKGDDSALARMLWAHEIRGAWDVVAQPAQEWLDMTSEEE